MSSWEYHTGTKHNKISRADLFEMFGSPFSSQKHNIISISVSAQASTASEVNTGMGYSVQGKVLPQKDIIGLIKNVLTAEEKEELLQELLFRAIEVVETGKSEYIDALRQVLIAWEYTAMVKSDDKFVRELEETREEIKNDPEPGVAWREFLRG
ncbi:hypothetical protein SAMN02745221_02145 [Thermosyntropha lipolytica DSM 11003]|uniref:Uncharacterized protein n=1 Tax=Thermosyntropha lipolytica DSM 11003 TaxID=1123382 RepID=A0A1M5RZY1_9FIRM|nr:hypothetical protein [Thermosyntropha lipolytica]SHH31932.1 hypothetical protein SAMN02745221_02145 [Thermosyntropha lipolytica DSM 11003]